MLGHGKCSSCSAAREYFSVVIKMARKRKNVRQKGKLLLSSYFKRFEDGDRVSLIVNRGIGVSFPSRLQGYSGKITGSRGKFKLVEIKDGNKLKTFIIHPVHLRGL